MPVKSGGSYRSALGHPRLEALVDEEAPDLLVRDLADELLDVHASVTKRASVAIRLGDLGLDGDDAFETRLEVRDLAHPPGRYRIRFGWHRYDPRAPWAIA